MTQKDSKEQNCIWIITKNQFYQFLKNDDFEFIATKMYIGSEDYIGLTKAFSIATIVFAPHDSEESFQFQKVWI